MLEQDSDYDEENPRFTEICARIDELEDRECVYTPEVLAFAGAVIGIGGDGKAAISAVLSVPETRRKNPRNRNPPGS